MPTKKNRITSKKLRKKNETTKIIKSESKKIPDLSKSIKSANEDKMLEKVEKYVDKNREKTSQEMIERKNKRPAQNFKE